MKSGINLCNWFPQKHRFDKTTSAVLNLLMLSGLPITRISLEKKINLSSLISNNEIETISNVLESLKLNYKYNFLKSEDIETSILPILGLIKLNNNNTYIIITELKLDTITFLDIKAGWKTMLLEELKITWQGPAFRICEIPQSNLFEFSKNRLEEFEIIKQSSFYSTLTLLENFLSIEECNKLIEISNDYFTKSTLFLSDEQKTSLPQRTSYSCILNDDNIIVNSIKKRLEKYLGIEQNYFENMQCISYSKDQEYLAHFDAFPENSSELSNGQRTHTCIFYLSDDFEGGSTYFPNTEIIVNPKIGRLLIFKSLLQDETIDPLSLHSGLPVISGNKIICTIWVRSKIFSTC